MIAGAVASPDIEYHSGTGHLAGMRHILLTTLMLAIWTSAANAACYADYKAKRDDPLRLHYGVAEIAGDCSLDTATTELTPRLVDAGWQLLTVVDVFDEAGLEERKDTAGDYYLRY